MEGVNNKRCLGGQYVAVLCHGDEFVDYLFRFMIVLYVLLDVS